MTRKPEDIREAIDTTLSGASHDPTLFFRVANASKGDTPTVKRKLTFSMALVLILVLMTSTVAVAATYKGVQFFLTERTIDPVTIDPSLMMTAITQTSTSEWLDVAVQDAYWDGSELSIAIRVAPKDIAAPLAMLTDIGLDGETFDTIWLSDADFNSNQMLVEDWLNGRTAILMNLPEMTFEAGSETLDMWHSMDYIHVLEDNAIIMMLQLPVSDMSCGAKVALQMTSTKLYPGDPEDAAVRRLHAMEPSETESTTVTVQLPALTNPVAPHEHEWSENDCVTRAICTICGRKGDVGEHDFQPGPGEKQETCTICHYTLNKP